jgi:ribonucleoside-diphosphate reductase alpha chain
MRPPINDTILAKRYYQGEETTWDEVCRRVAGHAAGKDEVAYNDFFQAISAGEFFPSRMTYMGTDNAFASSCFVFPIEDDLKAIMKTLSDACQVQKYGGGTGYNFSALRPKGGLIKTSGGDASGPVSFMGLFHNAMEVVNRAGKKHAAQMGILNCDHPDIFEFIQCKDVEGAYWTFNISVGITDAFMDAVRADLDWDLQFGGKVYKTIRAMDLWDYIVQHARHNGDPGVIFLDTVNRNNLYPEPIEATNPCWTGDTKVWTVEGPRTFAELAETGDDVSVLTQDNSGTLIFRTMHNPRLTRSQTDIAEILFDGGKKLRCTPTHKMHLRNGQIVEAKNLSARDSVASVYRRKANNKAYARLSNGVEEPFEHHVVISSEHGKRPDWPTEHTHHIDGQKRPEPVNHKVVSVTTLPEKEDVYNGTVDDTHSYFVMCGDNDAILSANCGEQALPPYVSCNLGSIDLSRFVGNGRVNFETLESAVRTGVSFLDGSIEYAFFPVEEVAEKTRRYRNIGLGVMGWADMLIMMGIPYNSNKAVRIAHEVMEFIDDIANDESIALGNGTRKNITVTSIAPTGSISFLAGCSSGIEPLFGIVTTRNTYIGSSTHAHWLFDEIARERGFWSEELMLEIAEKGTVQGNDKVPVDVQALFKTANEIDWEWHVKHQAAFQAHTDNAVSKTINLRNSATVADVDAAYWMAYETECKSTTVYRDGSRQVQVLENKTAEAHDMCPKCNAILFMSDGVRMCVTCGFEPSEDVRSELSEVSATKAQRPDVLLGRTYKKETPTGTAYVTVNSNEDGDDPFEVFLAVGKTGSDVAAVSEALGRTISLALRIPSPIDRQERLAWIADELIGIGGGRSTGFGTNRVRSLPDGVAQVFLEHLKSPIALSTGDLCPDCGEATLQHIEGCAKCSSCAYSEC